ncbi:hypothetical protein Lser_V15G24193 [Lactuca serriola]
MSAYCIISEDERRGKNQKKTSTWAQVKELCDANQAENPEKLGNRNIAQMKGCYKRLNESDGKWVGVYREAYRKRRSGMSMKDAENEAHKLYETIGSKFNDMIVFNEWMMKKVVVAQKRLRSTEEGDYCVQSNTEGASIGGSTIKRPTGRDAAKRKEKGKSSNEIVAELRAVRLSRDSEVEVMKKRLDLDQQREQKPDERELIKMQKLSLSSLLNAGLSLSSFRDTTPFLYNLII